MSATVPAGEFSDWLHRTEAMLRSGSGEADVPCGTCNACCRASMFIHIEPEETGTMQKIPGALLFAAPGFPKGHKVMGHSYRGHCPMLAEEHCSIYADRPRTCRRYDCRVLAAAGIEVDPRTQADVAKRVQAWAFTYASDTSREEQRMVQAAGAFLQKNRDEFPQGSLPSHPAPLAALAVRIHRLFSITMSEAERVRAILTELDSYTAIGINRSIQGALRRPRPHP